MAAIDMLSHLDMNQNELQNGVFQNLGTAPSTPVEGQFYFDSGVGVKVLKYWDGSSWVTSGSITQEQIEDYVGGMVSGNTETGIAVTYDDGGGKLNFVVSTLNNIPTATGDIAVGGYKITGLGTPTASTDAATKGYVDAARMGMDVKESVRAASTANVAVTYSATGGTSARGQITGAPNTLDGVSLASGNRILLKDQSTGAQNGIWVVTTVGSGANGVWDRATDFDEDAEVTAGAFTFVTEGTINSDTGWVLTTNDAITIGGASGTSLAFAQFSGAGAIVAGDGLVKTGSTIDVVGTANRITVAADSVDIAATYVGQTSITTLGTIGTGTWQGTAIGAIYGGTGQTSVTTGDLLYGSASNTWSKLAGVATGNVLISGGVATAPSWGKVGLTTHVSGVLPVANGGTNISSYTTGDLIQATGATTLAALNAVATGNVLISGGVGTVSSWGKVGLTTHVSGTLPIANGGTNSTATPTSGGVGYGTGTAHAYTSAGTAGQALLSAGSSAPTWTTLTLANLPDAAFKLSVKAATTANITLSGTQTIDGIAVVAADRVLVKDQSTPANNGIYAVAAGAWTRVTDGDTASEIAGAIVNVDQGTANGGKMFKTTFKSTDTLGTTAMNWYQNYTSADTISVANGGTGLTTITANSIMVGNGASSPTLVTGSQYQVLRAGASGVPAFGSINLDQSAAVTGTLPATNGGTGQASYAVGDILYASTTSALSRLADVATGSALISGGVGTAPSWGKIGLTTHVSGTLGPTNGGTGVNTVTTGDLLYGSAADTWSKLAGVATGNVLISGGVATAPSWGKVGLTTHVSGTLPIANGGTNSTATPTNGGVSYGTGSAFAFTSAGTSGQVLVSAGAAAPVWTTGNYTTTVGTGAATDITVTHNLGTRNVQTVVYRTASPYDVVWCVVENTTTNTVTLRFNTAPSSGQYTVFCSAI